MPRAIAALEQLLPGEGPTDVPVYHGYIIHIIPVGILAGLTLQQKERVMQGEVVRF